MLLVWSGDVPAAAILRWFSVADCSLSPFWPVYHECSSGDWMPTFDHEGRVVVSDVLPLVPLWQSYDRFELATSGFLDGHRNWSMSVWSIVYSPLPIGSVSGDTIDILPWAGKDILFSCTLLWDSVADVLAAAGPPRKDEGHKDGSSRGWGSIEKEGTGKSSSGDRKHPKPETPAALVALNSEAESSAESTYAGGGGDGGCGGDDAASDVDSLFNSSDYYPEGPGAPSGSTGASDIPLLIRDDDFPEPDDILLCPPCAPAVVIADGEPVVVCMGNSRIEFQPGFFNQRPLFVAYCGDCDHSLELGTELLEGAYGSLCTRTRRAERGTWKGSGRPLGALKAWLDAHHDFLDRDAHMKPSYKPSRAARRKARDALKLVDGADALFATEVPQADGEDSEPEAFT